MGKNKVWADFLLGKLHGLERIRGERISVTAFAEYLGESQQNTSRWLNGTTPEAIKIPKLADKLGNDIYAVLGFTPPDPLLKYVATHWDDLPNEVKDQIKGIVTKYSDRAENKTHPAPNDPKVDANG